MARKARAGHTCGGSTFDYDNVDVPRPSGDRAYVMYQVNPDEADVVRRIFPLAAMGKRCRDRTPNAGAWRRNSPR
jgi:hypothetical protein